MCELFAMSSRLPTDVRSSLEAFARHGGLDGPHKDGWGIGYYAGEDVRLVKDPEAAHDSECLHFLRQHPFTSGVVISHIRKATQGRLAMKNCQPFAREWGGRMHLFAHNGDLAIERLRRSMPLERFHPVGDTDSEYAFCALLDRFPVHARLDQRLGTVAAFAASLRALGPANFLYADGEVLFIHAHRRSPGGGEPGWRPLREGELLAVRGGEVVASPVPETERAL